MLRRKTYDKHRFTNESGLATELRKNRTRDRGYTTVALGLVKNSLDSFHIKNYGDFVELFQKFKLQSNDIKDFLYRFSIFYNATLSINENDKKINWLKPRVCRQSNASEKNLFITYLSYAYKSMILQYLPGYLYDKLAEKEKIDEFIEDFNTKIQVIEKQAQNYENYNNADDSQLKTIQNLDARSIGEFNNDFESFNIQFDDENDDYLLEDFQNDLNPYY